MEKLNLPLTRLIREIGLALPPLHTKRPTRNRVPEGCTSSHDGASRPCKCTTRSQRPTNAVVSLARTRRTLNNPHTASTILFICNVLRPALRRLKKIRLHTGRFYDWPSAKRTPSVLWAI